ncbi:MAG: FAD binding domain-containing protein [Hyphomicrobiaceae bacterium]
MIPGEFDYHRPNSVNEAVALLASLGETGRVVAGGHSLIPMMKLRLALPEHLIDLQRLDELKTITVEGGKVTIGALVTQHNIIESAALSASCPILKETALQIADPQVRYCGTIGGNVANGDPGNDMPAVMMALNASYSLASPDGVRNIPARAFYSGPFFTEISDNEILTHIQFDAPSTGHGSSYEKQKRKIGDYATAAAAVLIEMSGSRCVNASVALSNVGDTPIYVDQATPLLVGTDVGDSDIDGAINAAKAMTKPASDGRGPAEFRTHVAGEMVRRAINSAKNRAA